LAKTSIWGREEETTAPTGHGKRDPHEEEMQGYDRAKHGSWLDSIADTVAECKAEWKLAEAADADPCLITELPPYKMRGYINARLGQAQVLFHLHAKMEAARYAELQKYLHALSEDEQEAALANYNASWRRSRAFFQQQREKRRAAYLETAEANVIYDEEECAHE